MLLERAGDAAERNWITRIRSCDAQTMLETLRLVDDPYGGAAAYLRRAGVSELRSAVAAADDQQPSRSNLRAETLKAADTS